MVVQTLSPADPAADGSRWASMRTSLSTVWLHRIWLLWIIGAVTGAFWSGFIVIFVSTRRRLRSNIVNQFVVGLAISDFVFSFSCCITCLLHYVHGRWFGGDWMCVVQGFYCVYGFAASIWMNVIIAHELNRMASCPYQLKSYRPLPGRVVRRRIGIVHVAAVLFSCLSFVPGLPTDVGAFSGLACLPMEYDMPSTIWHWLVTMNLMLILPLLVLIYYFGRVYFLVFRVPDTDSKDKSVVRFFACLLTVFVLMWMNTGLFIWVLRIDGAGVMDGIGGFISHLQGMLSALIYLSKPDMREELRQCWRHLKQTAGRGRQGSVMGAAEMRHQYLHQHSSGVIARMSSQSAEASNQSLVSVSSERSLTMMIEELGQQVDCKLASLEEAPMRVVELQIWLCAGHFPRSSEHLARPYERGDVVIFVSHRWWGDTSPDDEADSKYTILCRGIHALMLRHELRSQDVVVWCDWACIEQDSPMALQKGIASLITYAAKASFVLIPVAEEPQAVRAARVAGHPNALWNYGERAWCRLEVYIFSCVAEVSGREAFIYSFNTTSKGLLYQCGFRNERLSRLESTFDASMLPSEGLLSHESDRELVKTVETEMRGIYVKNAILKEQIHVMSRSSQRTFCLAERQLECSHAPMLVSALLDMALAPKLRTVILDGNLLADDGVARIMEAVCSPLTSKLLKLSLGNNPRLGAEGVRAVALALGDPDCYLEDIGLGSCNLGGDDMKPLVASLALPTRLRHLDLSHNCLDDHIVTKLLTAAGGVEHPRMALDVEGNRISVAVFLRVARAGRALELGRAPSAAVSEGHSTTRSQEGTSETDLEQGADDGSSKGSELASNDVHRLNLEGDQAPADSNAAGDQKPTVSTDPACEAISCECAQPRIVGMMSL